MRFTPTGVEAHIAFHPFLGISAPTVDFLDYAWQFLYDRKWKAVDHKDTISPFEQASFINFNTTLSLTAVTMSNQTFVEWEGLLLCLSAQEYLGCIKSQVLQIYSLENPFSNRL